MTEPTTARLVWDKIGERVYETGVDRGVLYHRDAEGLYNAGFPWNGLTGFTESPSGAESNKQYADNQVYVNLVSAEELGGTLEAYTYPDEFEVCDGSASPTAGVSLGQQGRKTFGFAYRTLKGNDIDANDHGYKLHLIYGCLAAPSEKAYATVNDTPEAMTLSWGISTTPVEVGVVAGVNYKPTALITIDSTKVGADLLATFEDILYGSATDAARLPLPAEVIEHFAEGGAAAAMTIQTLGAPEGKVSLAGENVEGVEGGSVEDETVVTEPAATSTTATSVDPAPAKSTTGTTTVK